MRLVFMGTPEFAAVQLRACAAEHEVVEAYTRPDAASGRGATLRPSPVKQAAEPLSIPVRQPRSLRDPEERAHLIGLAPDAIVVAAYGLILPREILDVPAHGCINVHASLLPRWRGAAPIQRAILAGDRSTGVSIMRMDEGLDTGAVDTSAEIDIDELYLEELTDRLAEEGAKALLRTLDRIEHGTVTWARQDDALATYAQKVTQGDVTVYPSDAVDIALRKIRASGPHAPSRVTVAGRSLTLLAAERSDSTDSRVTPGAALPTRKGLVLGLSDGQALVTRLKPDGKSGMDAAAWARGARLGATAVWLPA